MKIIILGAGQVGSTLAASLSNDENDITLIDERQELLDKLQEKHDLRVLKQWGIASYFATAERERCGYAGGGNR